MPRFASFDRRNYRTVAAREGYAQWAANYEDTIKRDMDLWLFLRTKYERKPEASKETRNEPLI
jgi:hypothetical protein